MSYDTYYSGEVEITPVLTAAHLAMLHAIIDRENNPNTYEALVPEKMREALGNSMTFDASVTETGWLNFDYSSGSDRCDETDSIKMLVNEFFKPFGYSLKGEVQWSGSADDDRGWIYFDGDKVEAVDDEIINPGPSWDKLTNPHQQLVEVLREALPLLECLHASNTTAIAQKGRAILASLDKDSTAQTPAAATPTGDLQDFCVTWEIEVQAVTPEGAAREAQTIQRDPKSIAQTFKVYPCSNSLKVEEITLA